MSNWIALNPHGEPENEYYNFRTGQFDVLEGSPTDWSPYISQNPATQGMYSILVEECGWNPLDAALRVTIVSLGEPVPPLSSGIVDTTGGQLP